jgi:glycosyltransferase involved in cell wall biosynthesis
VVAQDRDRARGLPIALLEAMSYGLSVLVSDIPANKEVELPAHRYFNCGNVKDLGGKMASLLIQRMTAEEKEALRARIAHPP